MAPVGASTPPTDWTSASRYAPHEARHALVSRRSTHGPGFNKRDTNVFTVELWSLISSWRLTRSLSDRRDAGNPRDRLMFSVSLVCLAYVGLVAHQPTKKHVVVIRSQVDSLEEVPHFPSCEPCRAGTGEWIENAAVFWTASRDTA